MANVRLEDQELNLRLMDTSPGGVGLFSAATGPLRVGVAVHVTIDSDPPKLGVIRYVKASPFGGYQVGIEWTEPRR